MTEYLDLGDFVLIACEVMEVEPATLINVAKLDLADSALHAPQAGFGDEDFYPTLSMKAAVLCSRINRNHPLPDGNKRAAYLCMTEFLARNGWDFAAPSVDEVDGTIRQLAANEITEDEFARWVEANVALLSDPLSEVEVATATVPHRSHTESSRPMSDAANTEQGSGTDDYCYLTTTGRRTHRPHRIEIWYAARGDTLYLLAGSGRSSDWVQNLSAEPSVTVEVDGAVRSGRGRVVEDGDEADGARSLVFAKYAPRNAGDLTDWRERALPVAVDLGQQ